MMRTIISLAAAIALLSTAYVQVRDDFNGGFNPNLPWIWTVSGNTPECTVNPEFFGFTGSELAITPRGAVFSNVNSILNLPSLTVSGTIPDSWYIETQFRIDWSQVLPNAYTQAGIIIHLGADQYFQALVTRSANPPSNLVSGSSHREVPGWFEWGCVATQAWEPDNNYIGVRIEHVPNYGDGSVGNAIVLYYRHSGTNGQWVLFDGGTETAVTGAFVQFAEGNCPWMRWRNFYNEIMDALINQQGVKIGIYADSATVDPQDITFYFDYFETNLPVAQTRAGDVDGNGCVDDADLLTVLFGFGSEGCESADTNRDGVVDDADLLIVLFNFGSGC